MVLLNTIHFIQIYEIRILENMKLHVSNCTWKTILLLLYFTCKNIHRAKIKKIENHQSTSIYFVYRDWTSFHFSSRLINLLELNFLNLSDTHLVFCHTIYVYFWRNTPSIQFHSFSCPSSTANNGKTIGLVFLFTYKVPLWIFIL